jgi:hypothetical protein
MLQAQPAACSSGSAVHQQTAAVDQQIAAAVQPTIATGACGAASALASCQGCHCRSDVEMVDVLVPSMPTPCPRMPPPVSDDLLKAQYPIPAPGCRYDSPTAYQEYLVAHNAWFTGARAWAVVKQDAVAEAVATRDAAIARLGLDEVELEVLQYFEVRIEWWLYNMSLCYAPQICDGRMMLVERHPGEYSFDGFITRKAEKPEWLPQGWPQDDYISRIVEVPDWNSRYSGYYSPDSPDGGLSLADMRCGYGSRDWFCFGVEG